MQVIQEQEEHAGIEGATTRAHRQPVERENPIVVATLLPPRRAQRLEPLPRLPRPPGRAAARASDRGSSDAMYSYERPWKPYLRTPFSV